MSKEEKLVSVLSHNLVSLRLQPPSYHRPKWYQFKLRRLLAYYDKNNWPYRLEA